MRTVLLLALAQAILGKNLGGKYASDPETAKDCVSFYDNDGSQTCEQTRDEFAITPEQFHEWNPSIGLDCKPWHEFVSYCIVTVSRMKDTVWQDQGCYSNGTGGYTGGTLQNDQDSTLDKGLTIPKCLTSCGENNVINIVGVANGNQCWCSGWPKGARVNSDRCNVPCDGDSKTMCGGKDAVRIFGIVEVSKVGFPNGTMYQGDLRGGHVSLYTSHAGSSATRTSSPESSSVASTQSTTSFAAATPSESSSGARRNRAFF